MTVLLQKRLFLIAVPILLLASAYGLLAQEAVLRGSVLDEHTRAVIPDVNITLPSGEGHVSTLRGTFSIRIQELKPTDSIRFTHVSYEGTTVSFEQLRRSRTVYLQPRIIPLQTAEIEGSRRSQVPLARDIPQTVSVLEAKHFDIRGYLDAGDLLRTDHSIQVDEDITGKKTLSIRGGNADDVVVLYNGIKLNSSYDNVYDMALVELWDVERFEIIKGSNTVLYGGEAFSGIVNIVPKREYDYTARFQQQIGSYDSGIWGLQLAHTIGPIGASYGIRNGGMRRAFEDDNSARLVNTSMHHTGSIRFETGAREQGDADLLQATFRHSSQSYDNERDHETLDDVNLLAALDYHGSLFSTQGWRGTASFTQLKQDMALSLSTSVLRRSAYDNGVHASLERHMQLGQTELLLSYQCTNNVLDLADRRLTQFGESLSGTESSVTRWRHGFVGIGKLHGETGSEFLSTFDFDVSVRHDLVLDRPRDMERASMTTSPFSTHDWSATMAKFAVNLKGVQQDFLLDVFLSYGSNVKFPSLQQQLSLPLEDGDGNALGRLDPEQNQSVELGAAFTRELTRPGTLSGWQLEASFFQNNYTNKFREITTPGIPLPFYDNVDDAQIAGLEGKASLFFFRKQVRFEFGISRYFISEEAAFPFKSSVKRTAGLTVEHAGYALNIFYFYEGEQTGLLRTTDGTYGIVDLPAFTNLDVHMSTYVPIGNARLFGSLSLRNLLGNSSVALQGLAIRDRRYYATIGIQY